MAPIRLIDMLRRGERFHSELGAYYEQCSHGARRDDVRRVLEYMARHEQYLEACLKAYERDAPKRLTEAWFKVCPDDHCRAVMSGAEIRPDMTVDELITLAIQYDDCLIQVYRELADQAVSDELREALQHLLAMEQEEERRIVRDLAND